MIKLLLIFIFCIDKDLHEAAVNLNNRTTRVPRTKMNNDIKKPTVIEHQDFWVPLAHCNVGEITK